MRNIVNQYNLTAKGANNIDNKEQKNIEDITSLENTNQEEHKSKHNKLKEQVN